MPVSSKTASGNDIYGNPQFSYGHKWAWRVAHISAGYCFMIKITFKIDSAGKFMSVLSPNLSKTAIGNDVPKKT